MAIKENTKQWSGFLKARNHIRIQKVQSKINIERLDTGEPRLKMDETVDMMIEDYCLRHKIK